MAYKVKIDNVVYDLRDDFTIKDELNETLDSAIISFITYGHEAQFESFDNAEIYDTENKITPKYFLVDSCDDEIYSFGSSFETDDHNYTVTFFSETKELERITLPDYTITQAKDLHRSVWLQIVRVCALYVPRIKVFDTENANGNHYKYVRKFALDPALETRFSNIECPEMQWNNPTLREVLNDLVSVDDCIIVVKQGVISFYDLKQRGNPIDVSKLSFSKKSMTSQDYAGELTINMQNAIGHKNTVVCENVSLRAPTGTIPLTTDNGVIPTMQPIYAIKKLRVRFPTKYQAPYANPVYRYGWETITDRVLEKEEWDLLSNVAVGTDLYNNLSEYTDMNGITVKKHKVNFLYYKRGERNIYNFCTSYGESFWSNASGTTSFADEAMPAIASLHKVEDQEIGSGGRDLSAFEIEYESMAEHALKVGKYLPQKHPENRIFDSQSNSYVDLAHQSIYEYAKVNRLGHKIRTIEGNYEQESEVPKLGDYIGDEILFSREITYTDNLISFKGLLMPNYVLKNFFTGVKAKKRSWQIAKNEDALSRHDIYKIYVEASFSLKTDDFDYEDADGIKTFQDSGIIKWLVPFYFENESPYKFLGGCMVQTRKNTAYYPNSSDAIVVDSESSIEGNSVCLNFGFDDNHISAHYIKKQNSERLQNFYRYTDSYGEADDMTVILHNVTEKSGYYRSEAVSENYYETLQNESFVLPRISKTSNYYGHFVGSFVFNLQKDNREIIKTTLQFEYCSDTSDIIITKHLLNRIPYFNRTSWSEGDEKIYFSTEKYKIGDEVVKGTLSDATVDDCDYATGDSDCRSLLLAASGTIPENAKSWGIVDGAGNLLLGVNFKENETPTMRVYFNFLRSRDDKIYNDAFGGVVIGDITPAGITQAQQNYSASASQTDVNVQGRIVRRNQLIVSSPQSNEVGDGTGNEVFDDEENE